MSTSSNTTFTWVSTKPSTWWRPNKEVITLPYISSNVDVQSFPKVKQAIFNKKATIVYFDDGSKVIVKRSYLDNDNREAAIVYAIVKRVYGKFNPDTGLYENAGIGSMLQRVMDSAIVQEESKEKAKTSIKTSKQKDIVRPWVVKSRKH